MNATAAETLAECMSSYSYVEGMILLIPWFVSAAIFGIGQVFGSALIQLFSLYLFITHSQMVAFNGAWNEVYADPWCKVQEMLGGFSHVTHYVVSVTVFVLIYHAYKWKRVGWMLATFLFIALVVPPFVLMWLGVRGPISVGVTLVVSTLLTFGFFGFAVGLNPEPQYIIRTGLVEALHYTSFDLLLTPEQKQELEFDRRVTECITRQCTQFFKKQYAWKNGLFSGPPSAYAGLRGPATTTRVQI